MFVIQYIEIIVDKSISTMDQELLLLVAVQAIGLRVSLGQRQKLVSFNISK